MNAFQPSWVDEGADDLPAPTASARPHHFQPTWAHDVLIDLRFDEDADTAQDYSGYNRDAVWENASGGGRTFLPAFAPGGGQDVIGASGSGYFCEWDGMDYVGDDEDGANSEPLFFIWAGALPDLSQEVVLLEGGDGNNYWQFIVQVDGGLRFDSSTAAYEFSWACAPGIVTTGRRYTLAFLLREGGTLGAFFMGNDLTEGAELATTRGNL